MKKPSRNLVYWLALIVALGLLAVGAVAAQNWTFGLAVLPIAALDGLSRRFGWSWCPTALLLVYIALAAGALFIGFPPALMIAGAAAALFHWELSDPFPREVSGEVMSQESLFYRQRLRYLSISIAVGLALAEVGLFLEIDLPFAGAVLAALILLFSLYRLFILRPKKP